MARCSTRSYIHGYIWISAHCMYSHWPLELQQLLYYQSAFVNHPPFSSVQDLRILSTDCFKNLCVTKIILSSRGVLSKVSSRKKGGRNGHWPIYIRSRKALEFQVFVNKCIKKKKIPQRVVHGYQLPGCFHLLWVENVINLPYSFMSTYFKTTVLFAWHKVIIPKLRCDWRD